MIKRIILGCVIVLLAGCLSPINTAPQNNYVLNTTPPLSPVYRTKPQVLLVSMPRLDAVMDNNKMVYLDGQHRLGYFSINRWATSPNEMFFTLLLNTLQQQSSFRAVVSTPYGGQSDLQLNIVNFSIIQDFTVHPSVVQVKMNASLRRIQPSYLIKARAVQATVATSADTPAAGVVAANQAVANCLAQLVAFVNNE